MNDNSCTRNYRFNKQTDESILVKLKEHQNLETFCTSIWSTNNMYSNFKFCQILKKYAVYLYKKNFDRNMYEIALMILDEDFEADFELR